jgi:hypothetical protein
MSPSGLDRAREIAARESGLAVALTIREDGSAHASVVNAGVLAHPVTGEAVVAFVSRGGTRKLVHLRRRPRATVVFRSGWDWMAVEGDTELAGPDDRLDELDPADLPGLLRNIYASAAGGSPADWAAVDQVIADERHTAVLVRPDRISSA